MSPEDQEAAVRNWTELVAYRDLQSDDEDAGYAVLQWIDERLEADMMREPEDPPGLETSPLMKMHISRHWPRTLRASYNDDLYEPQRLEAQCPCPKEPCGCVAMDKVDPACPEHPIERGKTMRQIHAPNTCPARNQ